MKVPDFAVYNYNIFFVRLPNLLIILLENAGWKIHIAQGG